MIGQPSDEKSQLLPHRVDGSRGTNPNGGAEEDRKKARKREAVTKGIQVLSGAVSLVLWSFYAITYGFFIMSRFGINRWDECSEGNCRLSLSHIILMLEIIVPLFLCMPAYFSIGCIRGIWYELRDRSNPEKGCNSFLGLILFIIFIISFLQSVSPWISRVAYSDEYTVSPCQFESGTGYFCLSASIAWFWTLLCVSTCSIFVAILLSSPPKNLREAINPQILSKLRHSLESWLLSIVIIFTCWSSIYLADTFVMEPEVETLGYQVIYAICPLLISYLCAVPYAYYNYKINQLLVKSVAKKVAQGLPNVQGQPLEKKEDDQLLEESVDEKVAQGLPNVQGQPLEEKKDDDDDELYSHEELQTLIMSPPNLRVFGIQITVERLLVLLIGTFGGIVLSFLFDLN